MAWPLWESPAILLKVKHLCPCDPAILLRGTHPEELRAMTPACSCTCSVHSSAIHNSQQPSRNKPVSINRGLDKWNVIYIHTMEYYSTLKRSETPIGCYNMYTSWKYRANVWFHLYEVPRIGKFTETELVVTKGGRSRGQKKKKQYCLMSTKFLFGTMKMF